jgi:hypothetical protein
MILYIKPTLVITNIGLVFDFLLSLISVFLIFNHRMIGCEFFPGKKSESGIYNFGYLENN